ncbi:hypothetical protein ACFQ15_08245 [Sphingomonas hankookensis]|uniref:hypothetical protein n=1 Tax=Sphingomonas hankookensis TaxID=563996 RepID=UPI001F5ACFE6|nr:hypothetical protein [Sphingomonas hankookensis]
MYDIRFDPDHRLFHLTLCGFWTMTTVVQFAAELLARTTAARLRYRRFAMLSDSTGFPVQSTQVATYFERIMIRGIQMDIGPCAIIVGSHLNKLQAERVFDSQRVRVFTDRARAEAWLTEVWP